MTSSIAWYVFPSQIHGLGLFPGTNVFPGDRIGTAIDTRQIVTPMGSKINHSYAPNCTLRRDQDGTWGLYSFRHVPQGTELTADYRYTPDFILKPRPEWK